MPTIRPVRRFLGRVAAGAAGAPAQGACCGKGEAACIHPSHLSRGCLAAGNIVGPLAKQVGIGNDAFAGFQEKLLTDRNIKMRATAEPLLEQGRVFIAIGALHLPGKQGLVALLREAGYTVTPIE